MPGTDSVAGVCSFLKSLEEEEKIRKSSRQHRKLARRLAGNPLATIHIDTRTAMEPDRSLKERAEISQDELLALSDRIVTACRIAGLTVEEAEDLAQDVWAWLLGSGNLAMASLAPWLASVTENFVRRFLRHRWRETRVIGPAALSGSPLRLVSSAIEPDAVEARLFLDRLAARAPAPERKLLKLMSLGYRLSEAARRAGVTHGSEQFHLNRLRALAVKLGKPALARSPLGSAHRANA